MAVVTVTVPPTSTWPAGRTEMTVNCGGTAVTFGRSGAGQGLRAMAL